LNHSRLLWEGRVILAKAVKHSMQGHPRIEKIRSRVREERRLIRELEKQPASPSAKVLLRPAAYMLDDVEGFFLAEATLREPRSRAELAQWLDYTEQCLGAAVQQRKFYEKILKKWKS
jgi:hypothetical protein